MPTRSRKTSAKSSSRRGTDLSILEKIKLISGGDLSTNSRNNNSVQSQRYYPYIDQNNSNTIESHSNAMKRIDDKSLDINSRMKNIVDGFLNNYKTDLLKLNDREQNELVQFFALDFHDLILSTVRSMTSHPSSEVTEEENGNQGEYYDNDLNNNDFPQTGSVVYTSDNENNDMKMSDDKREVLDAVEKAYATVRRWKNPTLQNNAYAKISSIESNILNRFPQTDISSTMMPAQKRRYLNALAEATDPSRLRKPFRIGGDSPRKVRRNSDGGARGFSTRVSAKSSPTKKKSKRKE